MGASPFVKCVLPEKYTTMRSQCRTGTARFGLLLFGGSIGGDREENSMPQIPDADRSVFQDACGLHDFSTAELADIHQMAQQLKKLLDASKKREQERIAKVGS